MLLYAILSILMKVVEISHINERSDLINAEKEQLLWNFTFCSKEIVAMQAHSYHW